jgi:hypothetical protein
MDCGMRKQPPDLAKVNKRMKELMRPVDQQIMMCDDAEDVMIMACAMLQRVKEIFDMQLTEEGRKHMFRGLSE